MILCVCIILNSHIFTDLWSISHYFSFFCTLIKVIITLNTVSLLKRKELPAASADPLLICIIFLHSGPMYVLECWNSTVGSFRSSLNFLTTASYASCAFCIAVFCHGMSSSSAHSIKRSRRRALVDLPRACCFLIGRSGSFTDTTSMSHWNEVIITCLLSYMVLETFSFSKHHIRY